MEYLKKFNNFKKELNEEVEYEVTPDGYKIPLTSRLFEFINANTYNSAIELENIFDDDEEDDDEISKRIDNVDKRQYVDIIVDSAQEVYNEYVDEELKSFFGDLYVKGEILKFENPKEYNYKGDYLYIDIYFTDYVKAYEKFMDYIEENNLSGEFDRWLKETYKSYPGFIPFTPNTLEKLKTAFENGEVVYTIAAILTYVLFEIQKYDIEEAQMEFIEKVRNEVLEQF